MGLDITTLIFIVLQTDIRGENQDKSVTLQKEKKKSNLGR